MRPGEPVFARAVCLALTEGTGAALRTASEIARHAEALRTAASKVRTEGADVVIERLLQEDAVWQKAYRGQANAGDEHILDRELVDLPPELRWREWMLRRGGDLCRGRAGWP